MSDDFLSEMTNHVSTVTTTPMAVAPVINNAAPVVVNNSANMQADAIKQETLAKMESASPIKETSLPEKKKETSLPENNEKRPSDKPLSDNKKFVRAKADKYLDIYLAEDAAGNLINNEGEVIASAGKSRTHLEALKKEGRDQRDAAKTLAIQNAQLANQFKQLYDEFKGISEKSVSPLHGIVKETGFSEQQATAAIKFMKQYKENPIEAIKNILTQAKTDGIDLSKIGANITADPAFIKQQLAEMLEERLAPITRKSQQDIAHQEAYKEASEFLETYPRARDYQKAIGDAKTRFPEMSLAEIWLRLERELDKQDAPVTKHRKDLPVNIPKKQVKLPSQSRNYATMSFEQIAKTIEEDYS
jgi:hypothetical protein